MKSWLTWAAPIITQTDSYNLWSIWLAWDGHSQSQTWSQAHPWTCWWVWFWTRTWTCVYHTSSDQSEEQNFFGTVLPFFNFLKIFFCSKCKTCYSGRSEMDSQVSLEWNSSQEIEGFCYYSRGWAEIFLHELSHGISELSTFWMFSCKLQVFLVWIFSCVFRFCDCENVLLQVWHS